MHLDVEKVLARLDRVVNETLLPSIARHREPLGLTMWTAPGEPVPFEEARRAAYQPVSPGTSWGRPWATSWLRVTGRVPDVWTESLSERHRVELSLDLGFSAAKPGFQCEGLVRDAAGRALKGLHPRNHRVELGLRPGAPVDLFVEAAANPDLTKGNDFGGTDAFAPTALGDPATAPEQELYRLGRFDIRLVDVELERLERELRVLRGLAVELHDRDPRRLGIVVALDHALDVLDPDDLPGSAPRAREVLAPLLSAPASASAHRIVATGHAHIDSAWLWPARETARKCTRTFAGVLELMDADPDLVFTCSSAQQYAWVEQHDPELFSRISERVREGRFVPVGGMWVESDVTMPSGESLVRQFIEGGRYFADSFGVRSEVGWLPDSFGYSAALPQVLKQAGLRWFFTQKMCWNDTNEMPHHSFVWEGLDGSRIFTHFPPANTYSGDMRPTELARSSRNFNDHGRASLSLTPFGYGDGGGGPTRDMMALGRLQSDLEGSPRLRFGSAREFFEEAEAEYASPPVWSGEMYLEFHRGIFTSQARTKRGNRRNERLLAEAETWASAASVLAGHPYPYDRLQAAWRDVLLLQFHDILPGSSIAWVHREAEDTHETVTAILETIIAGSLAALTGEGDASITVNPAPVELAGVPARGGLLAPDGGGPSVTVELTDAGVELSNSQVRVRILSDGTVASMIELCSGRDLIPAGAPANLLQLHRDEPARWDAWDLDESYRNSVRDLTDGTVEVDGEAVVVRRSFGSSSVEQRLELLADAPTLLIRTETDWHERRKLLKLAFPLDLHAVHAAYETQFGHVTRPIHVNTSWDSARYEVCAHRWVHVGEPGFGAAVGNDGLYGHDVTRQIVDGRVVTQVRQSLLRAPTFPDPAADQGRHVIVSSLSVAPDIDAALRAGRRTDAPPRHVVGARVPRPLVVVEPEPGAGPTSVVAETVRLAVDRSGDLIVRLYESRGQRSRARLRAGVETGVPEVVDLLEEPSRAVPGHGRALLSAYPDVVVELRPFEVLTLRFPRPGPAGPEPSRTGGHHRERTQ